MLYLQSRESQIIHTGAPPYEMKQYFYSPVKDPGEGTVARRQLFPLDAILLMCIYKCYTVQGHSSDYTAAI